jgi:hypothetical protein
MKGEGGQQKGIGLPAVSALGDSYAQSRTPGAMRFASNQNEHISGLEAELRRAQAVTPALMAGILALAEARRSAPGSCDPADRIRHLIRAQAWTNGALALLEFGLPQWKLRCITYEDGEWFCSLGKQWPLPAWLDDVVTVSHPVLPLVILTALVEACAVTSCATEAVRTVPSVQPSAHDAVCCDNFL